MAFKKLENKIIEIQVDDSEVKKLYREFNNTSITYKIFLEERPRREVKALPDEEGKSSLCF